MNILKSTIENSILKGINYLHQNQFPNGEYCCYIAYDDSMKHPIPEANLFPTSLISYALLNLTDHPKVQEMLQLTGNFLEYQSMHGGAWNNFTMAHPYFKICPADVDNTACASIVMKAINRNYQNNEKILLYNRNKNQLFYTWFTVRHSFKGNKDYWRLLLRGFKHPMSTFLFWTQTEAGKYDVDGAVNANVLFYLGLRDETLPIINFMLDIIAENREDDCDNWYRNPFTIYYFFSRNLHSGKTALEPIRKPIVERILMTVKADGAIGGSVLDTALGIISLIKLDYRSAVLANAIHYLTTQQGEYGEWARFPLYYGGPKKLLCYGSEEITTGFCLEALALYEKEVVRIEQDINTDQV
ncbi:hypothetical protein OQY15_10800 [Pedobacter sp. MC2016-15]|uniref:hypothetical protein n=1 Tax=Pedobacter sp. MC2016-15 TaxID=2994473 RepID=UPI002245BCFE|nr:hypothetical protein [Pedobacter sp. MC2016-15]MCX2479579.1 hypothetical protein [Pedobacter sp. MC2016-15]